MQQLGSVKKKLTHFKSILVTDCRFMLIISGNSDNQFLHRSEKSGVLDFSVI